MLKRGKKIIISTSVTILVFILNWWINISFVPYEDILFMPYSEIGGSGYIGFYPFPTEYTYGSVALKAPNPEILWLGVIADMIFYAVIFLIIYRFSFRKK